MEFKNIAEGIYTEHTLPSGDLYTGPLNNANERHGFGLVIFTDDSYFLGDSDKDVARGFGTHCAADGTIS